jgi:hypothetical protein
MKLIFNRIFTMALAIPQINGNFANAIDFAIINTC